MEYEEHLEILIRNRFKLVQNLQVDRPFLMDYLLSKSVFDRDDYDLVRSEKTREQKACKVLDIIETKGEDGFRHFKDALQLINPNMYETLTGEKATYRESPIIDTMGLVDFFPDSGDGNRLIDQDILSSHLKRVTDDLRDMTLRYNTLLKEDQQLRKALEVCRREKDTLETRLEFLENQLAETEAVASETYSSANISLMAQYEAMQRDRNDNKDFIIQLQIKLLHSQEELEKRTRELEEYKAKCDNLEQQLCQVNENYIFQRCETQKLSAKLKTRTEEAKEYENLKHQCREKQYQVLELKSLLEDKTKELEEIKNWAEALKNRYDTVVEERNEMLIKQHTTVESLTHSQNENTDLKIKMNRMAREVTELKKERTKLEKEITVFRNQLKTQDEAYVKAKEEIEETKAHFTELLESKEKDLNDKKELIDYYQNELEERKAELRQSKEELGQTLKNNDDLMSQLSKLRIEFNMTVETLEDEISKWEDRYSNDIGDGDQSSTGPQEHEDRDTTEKDSAGYNWKKRATSDLVQSIRKRFTKIPENASLHTNDKKDQLRKSLSFDSWLEALVPAYNGLSVESRQIYSLDRTYGQKPMQPLPYETLAHMYSEGTNTTQISPNRFCKTSDRGTASLPFYDRLRLKHPRKCSSPFPLSECNPVAIHQLREYVCEKWKEEERKYKKPCQDEENSDDSSVPMTSSEPDDNNNVKSPTAGKKVIGFRPRSHAISSEIYTTERRHSADYQRSPTTPTNSTRFEKTSAEQTFGKVGS